MKTLLTVEELDEDELKFEDLQTLHNNLAEELCMDPGAQSNNELFKRYTQAYNKLQKVKNTVQRELNELVGKRNLW
jgi:hypothetical protein